jgi:hypothetical protein
MAVEKEKGQEAVVAALPGPMECKSPHDSTAPTEKWRRVLGVLLTGRRLNRFEAERIGDHTLNTTVSQLEARGVRVDRIDEVVEGRFGPVEVKRYWLRKTPHNLAAAELLVKYGAMTVGTVRELQRGMEVNATA